MFSVIEKVERPLDRPARPLEARGLARQRGRLGPGARGLGQGLRHRRRGAPPSTGPSSTWAGTTSSTASIRRTRPRRTWPVGWVRPCCARRPCPSRTRIIPSTSGARRARRGNGNGRGGTRDAAAPCPSPKRCASAATAACPTIPIFRSCCIAASSRARPTSPGPSRRCSANTAGRPPGAPASIPGTTTTPARTRPSASPAAMRACAWAVPVGRMSTSPPATCWCCRPAPRTAACRPATTSSPWAPIRPGPRSTCTVTPIRCPPPSSMPSAACRIRATIPWPDPADPLMRLWPRAD